MVQLQPDQAKDHPVTSADIAKHVADTIHASQPCSTAAENFEKGLKHSVNAYPILNQKNQWPGYHHELLALAHTHGISAMFDDCTDVGAMHGDACDEYHGKLCLAFAVFTTTLKETSAL